MISSRLIKSNNTAAGCVDIVDAYDPFAGNGVALYQLNGNANDVSGNYNGTATNVTYGTGVFGQAGVFNGSTSVINLGNVLNTTLSNNFTISAWINTNSMGGQIFGKGFWVANGEYVRLYTRTSTPRIQFGFEDGSGNNVSMSSNSENLEGTGWRHIVAVGDYSGSFSLYLDGQHIESQTVSGSMNMTNSSSAYIGNRESNNSPLNGSLDQVRIFNTALTPLEVEALYTEELCICGGTVDTLDILGDSSCIATYQLDGNANDLSGNYSGTPTDVSYGVGEFDLAGVFNGSSSRIKLQDNSLNFLTSYTASAWINSVSDQNSQTIVGNWGYVNGNAELGWFIRKMTGNIIRVSNYNGGASQHYNSTGSVSLNTWTNVVVTNTQSEAKIYINGQLDSTHTTSGFITNASYPMRPHIGAYQYSAGTFGFFDGSIDQVRIFNKALNSTEVTTLYNETACANTTREAGVTQILGDNSCVAYYKLDGTAADETGTYDGTFTNPNYGNGEFDFAGVFNGTSSYITTPITYNSIVNLNDKTQDFSFSLWMYTSSLPSGTKNVFAINEYAPSYQYIGLVVNGSSTNFVSYPGGANGDVAITTTDLNVWTNIVCVRESSTMKIYKNGSLIQSTPMVYPNMSLDSTLRWVFGRRSDGGNDNYFNGLIDQVRFFNKAVSPSEVTTLYDEGI